MVLLKDHGNLTVSATIDASTFRVHRFVIADTSGTFSIGAPSGLDDGEELTLVIQSTGNPIGLSWNSAYKGAALPSVANDFPSGYDATVITFVRIGSDYRVKDRNG